MSDAGQGFLPAPDTFNFYAVPTSIPLAGIVSQANVTLASLTGPSPPAKLLCSVGQAGPAGVLADAGIVFEQATLRGLPGSTEPSAYFPMGVATPMNDLMWPVLPAGGPTTVVTVDGTGVPGPEAFYVLAMIGSAASTTLTSGDLLLRIKVLTKES